MSLVILSSGVLLAGCGAESDTNVQTEETGSNPGSGSNTGNNPGTNPSPNPGDNDTGGNNDSDEGRSLSLSAQPSDTVLFPGQSHTFTVSYSSSHSATVYWFHNGKPVGTGNSYTISNVQPSHVGNYSCSVTDGTLVANCNNFSLQLAQPVSIVNQSSNQAITEGDNATLSVTAQGSGPLSYQWYFNGKPISGATSATLRLNNIKLANQGDYYCVVSNAGSEAQSSTIRVNVAAAAVYGVAQITWSRPTTRADGSTLSASDIQRYTLYHTDSENGALQVYKEINVQELSGGLVYETDELVAGTHWFAMTTTDTNGQESAMSNRFSVTIH